MKRMSIAILITMVVTLFGALTTHAASYQNELRTIIVTDFSNDHYVGALQSVDGDSFTAINFASLSGVTHEDTLSAYGNAITATLQLNDTGYNGIMTVYSATYNTSIDMAYTLYTDDHHTIGYCTNQGDYSECQIDGKYGQFYGFIVNGTATKIRSADAYNVNGSGWIIQNGNLIRYSISNDEENTHTILLPLILF